MSTEAEQLNAIKLTIIGALAEDGTLEIAKRVKAEIQAIVTAANLESDGVGDGALMLAYCDCLAEQ